MSWKDRHRINSLTGDQRSILLCFQTEQNTLHFPLIFPGCSRAKLIDRLQEGGIAASKFVFRLFPPPPSPLSVSALASIFPLRVLHNKHFESTLLSSNVRPILFEFRDLQYIQYNSCGKDDLLTVYLGKLDVLSVTDFSLHNLPRGNFIVWVLDMSRKQ